MCSSVASNVENSINTINENHTTARSRFRMGSNDQHFCILYYAQLTQSCMSLVTCQYSSFACTFDILAHFMAVAPQCTHARGHFKSGQFNEELPVAAM